MHGRQHFEHERLPKAFAKSNCSHKSNAQLSIIHGAPDCKSNAVAESFLQPASTDHHLCVGSFADHTTRDIVGAAYQVYLEDPWTILFGEE